MTIRVRRAYDPSAAGDGCRVLVDRLWPRGLARDEAQIDHWLRELAPSNELRRWFAHDAERWDAFCQRYAEELQSPSTSVALAELRQLITTQPTVTLLYGARDAEHNNAQALRLWLQAHDSAR
ncbi:DUF488 domain-containing protein [Thauera sp. WH-2]|uniref:DUF488 domain-containing protein n=1 Tax=Thauera sp. WH-2 TaxID=3401574 RepID=UPI003AAF020D